MARVSKQQSSSDEPWIRLNRHRRTHWTHRTRVQHFFLDLSPRILFSYKFLGEIFFCNRIILSNVSEVSGMKDCMLRYCLFPAAGCSVKKYAACAVSEAQAARCVLFRIILWARHPAEDAFLRCGIFRRHSPSLLVPYPACRL